MAVHIRLSRIGRKNRPYWRVVAMDSRKKRDGAFLANFGTYDPIKHEVLSFDHTLLKEWKDKGAQCSPSVVKIVKKSLGNAKASEKKAPEKKASVKKSAKPKGE